MSLYGESGRRKAVLDHLGGLKLSALVAFNAKACEEAAHPRCVCACGGRLHGKRHSRKWVNATVAKLELEQLGASQTEIELEET